jgi:glutathione S-transferase
MNTNTARFITLETTPGCGQTPRVAFFLEELGIPYVIAQKPEGHFLETYGRVGPRVVDEHGAHFESGATLRHLARVYRENDAVDLARAADTDEWLAFSMRLGLASLSLMRESWDKTPRADRIEEENKKLASMLAVLDQALADRIFLLGDFGVVDCAFASLVRIGALVDLARWPRVHTRRVSSNDPRFNARSIASRPRRRSRARPPTCSRSGSTRKTASSTKRAATKRA